MDGLQSFEWPRYILGDPGSETGCLQHLVQVPERSFRPHLALGEEPGRAETQGGLVRGEEVVHVHRAIGRRDSNQLYRLDILTEAVSIPEIGSYCSELVERGLKVLDNLRGDHLWGWKVL